MTSECESWSRGPAPPFALLPLTMSTTRKRSNSVKQALDSLEPHEAERPVASPLKPTNGAATRPARSVKAAPWSLGATSPLISWLVKPGQSFTIIAITVATWAVSEYGTSLSASNNPLSPLLFIQYPLQPTPSELLSSNPGLRYGKGLLDLCFLGFYIIVFSFLRQSLTEFIIKPFARSLGLKSESKLTRFMEQAYAIVYFSASGAYGVVSFISSRAPASETRLTAPLQYVMSGQKSWWYQTEHYWLEFPHW